MPFNAMASSSLVQRFISIIKIAIEVDRPIAILFTLSEGEKKKSKGLARCVESNTNINEI
jgi:hypothetical protein